MLRSPTPHKDSSPPATEALAITAQAVPDPANLGQSPMSLPHKSSQMSREDPCLGPQKVFPSDFTPTEVQNLLGQAVLLRRHGGYPGQGGTPFQSPPAKRLEMSQEPEDQTAHRKAHFQANPTFPHVQTPKNYRPEEVLWLAPRQSRRWILPKGLVYLGPLSSLH